MNNKNMTKQEYYEHWTIRKARRILRKLVKRLMPGIGGCKVKCVLKNETGTNILKARRYKGRFLNK